MRTVRAVLEIATLIVVEAVTEQVVNITIVVIIDTLLAILLSLVPPHIVSQVLVVVVNRSIDNRNDYVVRTHTLGPRGNYIDISTCLSTVHIGRAIRLNPIGTAVLVVPLLLQTGIVERQLVILGCCNLKRGLVLHLANCYGHLLGQHQRHVVLNNCQLVDRRQHLAHLRHRNALIERDSIPQVQTCLALTSLETTCIGEQTLHLVGAHILAEYVDCLDTRFDLTVNCSQRHRRLNRINSRFAELNHHLTGDSLLCAKYHLRLLRQQLRRHRAVDVHRVVNLRIGTRCQHCCCAHQE